MKYLNALKTAVLSEDLFETEEIIENIKCENDAFDYIEHILNIMEENPYLDYGMPGPLVHFMETFSEKGYEEILIKSIRRSPTMHTIWMVNRILNDTNSKNREEFITELQNNLLREDLDYELKNDIKECLKIHYKE